MRIYVLLAVLLLSGCFKNYVMAEVQISGTKAAPGKVMVALENRDRTGSTISKTSASWEKDDIALKFKVEADTTVAWTLKYPGGPTVRDSEQVPKKQQGNSWPLSIVVPPVNSVDETGSVEWLKENAANLSLVGKSGEVDAGYPPPSSTKYSEVAKFIGSLAVMKKDWKPTESILAHYQVIVPVKKAPPPPTPGTPISKKLNLKTSRDAKAALNVPIYGSVGGGLSVDTVYHLNFELSHEALLGLDSGIFETLLDINDKTGASAFALLELWEKMEPDAQIVALRSVRYISSGTIGVIKGQEYQADLNAAVASVFTSNAAYSFNVNDESYTPLTGNVTAWQWANLKVPLRTLLKNLRAARKPERNAANSGLQTFQPMSAPPIG